MNSRPLITIGIPTYNRLNYLKEALSSARAQTYSNIEILISQNPHRDLHMTSEIAEYCDAIARTDTRIRHELQQSNLGQTANFQWIADNARGEYLFFIGDDDRLLPDAVETLSRGLGPDIVVSFGRRHIIDENGSRQPPCVRPARVPAWFFLGWPFSQYEVPGGRLADPELWAWRQAMGVETSLISTEAFRLVRYREELDMPDVQFFIALAREGGGFVFFPEYVTEYRFHSGSSTTAGFVNYRGLFQELSRLEVRREIEPYKRDLLKTFAFQAVSKSLLSGDLDFARQLLANEYYPSDGPIGAKGLIMKLSAAMPGELGKYAYNLLYSIKNRRRYKVANA